jgi:D-alanine-D-alanine ligase
VSDVAVIFGGPSPEHDVSVLTGLQAARGLSAAASDAATVRAMYWSKTGAWFGVDARLEAESFLDGIPRGAARLRFTAMPGGGFSEVGGRLGRGRDLAIDAAVVCCHGGPGEDGTLQAALDLAGIRYTGPTVSGAALGMDKLAFAALMADAGLPTLPRILLGAESSPPSFAGPYIVKPRFGGSSIGIDVVEDFATALARLSANPHFRSGAVLEPFRTDLDDLQLAVRSWPELQLSAVERPLKVSGSSDILDYRNKYVAGEGMAGAPRELPARISGELETSLRIAARRVAELVGIRGVARIDFLSDGNEFVVNEVNTIPGSMARYLWVDPPLSFSDLLVDLLTEARERPTHTYTASGADGTVLRSAGSIAGKLG